MEFKPRRKLMLYINELCSTHVLFLLVSMHNSEFKLFEDTIHVTYVFHSRKLEPYKIT